MSVSGKTSARAAPTPVSVHIYIAFLAIGAVAVALYGRDNVPLGRTNWLLLAALGAVLTASEYLFVRFRHGGQVNALNLMEAPLPVLLFAFSLHPVMIVVAASQLAGGILRRNQPVKAIFNIAQWTVGAALGRLAFEAIADPHRSLGTSIAAAFIAVAAVACFNHLAFSVVLALANRRSIRSVLSGVAPVIVPGWVTGWFINSVVGLLLLLAYLGHPAAVVLFPIPLVMLHFAYRGYAGARTDRLRLAGLLRAADALIRSIDPADEIEGFLQEVAACFEGRAAMLVLRLEGTVTVHSARGREYSTHDEQLETLAAVLLRQGRSGRTSVDGKDEVARALVATSFRDCVFAPLVERDLCIGAIAVLDQSGLEGFEQGELTVLDALGRHTAALLSKGKLMHAVLDERTKLTEIVSSISDGLFTIDRSGVVQSWNPAMERITGASASDVVGRAGALNEIPCYDLAGSLVRLTAWGVDAFPPRDLLLGHRDGHLRRIAASYGMAGGEASRSLIVVMRDMTTYEELQELRREATRLAAAEAAQRAVVAQLQEAMTPPAPTHPDVEIGVHYVASDPASPTGGDLYDVQELPSGDIHIAVVDVVGHGVAATKDALTVIYVLRVLAAEGCPLEDMIARADSLIGQLDDQLAATVVLVRYQPERGVARIAGGGHPPALIVREDDGVEQVPAPGGAIGWPGAGSSAIPEVRLDPGDRLVLYTDGLIEARKDIIEGEEMLMRLARQLSDLPAQRFVEELVGRSLPEDRRDDTLALTIRRAAPVRARTWSMLPTPEEASAARRHAMDWLLARGLDDDTVSQLGLVVSELVANAVAAARSSVELSIDVAQDNVTIVVGDDGAGPAALASRGFEQPPHMADAGRGLFLVRALTDSVVIDTNASGSTMRCVRRLDAGHRVQNGKLRAPAKRPLVP
ncbi:MAG: SpoIIE family protein phosphatase [Actinomycetota bacterium]